LAHLRERRLCHIEVAVDVRADGLVAPLVIGRFRTGVIRKVGGVVHQDVEVAEGRYRAPHGLVTEVGIGDVAGKEKCRASLAGHRVGRRSSVRFIGRRIDDRDIRPFMSEQSRHGAPDLRASASDDGDFAIQASPDCCRYLGILRMSSCGFARWGDAARRVPCTLASTPREASRRSSGAIVTTIVKISRSAAGSRPRYAPPRGNGVRRLFTSVRARRCNGMGAIAAIPPPRSGSGEEFVPASCGTLARIVYILFRAAVVLADVDQRRSRATGGTEIYISMHFLQTCERSSDAGERDQHGEGEPNMRASRLELIGLGLAVVIAGCSGGQRDSAAETRANAPTKQERTPDERTTERANAELPTPFDQGSSETDVRITTAIRQALVAKDGLSVGAANATVITNGGVVVLRGAVRDVSEKNFVRGVAESTPGATRVVDLLEYTTTH